MLPNKLLGFRAQLRDFVSEAGFCTFTITCKSPTAANNLIYFVLTIPHSQGMNIVMQNKKSKVFFNIAYPETTPIDEIKTILKNIDEGAEQWRK